MPARVAIDRAQRRFPPLGYPIAVVYKFFDDMGSYLSALLAYYAFVSLFPLLILATTILGVVLAGDPHLQQHLIRSALSEFPIISDRIKSPNALSGSWVSITVSTLVALYGALGAAQAFQFIANSVWQVPRNSRPNPFTGRGKSIGLIGLLGTSLLATIGLTQVVPRLVHLEGLASLGIKAGTLIIDGLALMVAYRVATSRPLRWQDTWPGALFAALMWQVLQRFGGLYVEHVLQRNKTMGDLAVVLGLILFLYIAGIIIVISMEINAVLAMRLWPRALLTPFTDNVELTEADARAYTGLAKAARLKGFQQIDIGFEKPPQLPEAPGKAAPPAPWLGDMPLPLDFENADRAPEPTPPPATVPMPARPSQDPREAHRLPPVPAPGPGRDEARTIPMVGRHPVATDDEDDVNDTAPVIRGPWSAER
ncbi:YihY/virulence factor BrkB family protein [Flexivirga caeni]|uniref:YihY/virulence factor BrkB family protein n=1 Tax=Flexivirga caeni TaxID=2294115 RepID=UPI001C659BB2|nr:YihY/virulence factor BrkB family protein [Flexivirga caeni]